MLHQFVVDGNWTTNANAPQETDESNNINNVLKPEDIQKSGTMSEGIAGATISGVTPGSTTAQLAGKVPKEPEHPKDQPPSSDVPGGFPSSETPYHEAQEFSVKPIPASSGAGNPVSLKPGEKVPDPKEFSTNDTTTADTLDKKSYERSGDGPSALQGAGKAYPLLKTKLDPRTLAGIDFSIANPTIQSAGAGATTAALAGQVPKEPRREAKVIPASGTQIAPEVPDVVQESIADSKFAPEAAANEEAVQEKAAVESQLLKDVKPTDAEGEPAPTASATTAEKAPAATDPNAGVTTAAAPATTPAQNEAVESAKGSGPDSRDVSPLSHPKSQKQPTITTGAATTSTGATSTPNKTEATPVSKISEFSLRFWIDLRHLALFIMSYARHVQDRYCQKRRLTL